MSKLMICMRMSNSFYVRFCRGDMSICQTEDRSKIHTNRIYKLMLDKVLKVMEQIDVMKEVGLGSIVQWI